MNGMIGQVRNHTKGRSARLWLIAAAGALLLLALGRAPVGATPMLTATPNPVLIPAGTPSAVSEVKWAGVPTGPSSKVSLVIDNIPVIPLIMTAAGKYDITVTPGSTHVALLRTVSTGATLASVTIKAPLPACPKACITKVDVTPHGTFAGFAVTTLAPTKLHIEVSEQAPSPTHTFATVVSAKDSPVNTTHTLDLLNLKPNTLYYYVVRAEDSIGFKFYRTEKFTTLKQKIDVTFTQIHVIDDSDDLSGGDLKFWFYIPNNAPLVWQYPDDAVDTGDNLAIALSGTVLNTNGVLDLKVNGFDDDDDFGGGLCSNGTATPPLGSGSNDCADWIEKTWQNLSMTKSGLGEVYSAPFSITASEIGVPLAFTVFGTYTVSYF